MGCIYYHKNKINGYMYIGKSIYEPNNIKWGRWGTHGQGYKSNKYFWNAINKYGWENFEHNFFEYNIPNETLNEKEIFYISKYHTYTRDPKYCGGYNLTPGGESSINTWWPEEDAWLCENYSLDKKRIQLIKEYRQAFPNSYHSDNAVKARLKTLRLSNIENRLAIVKQPKEKPIKQPKEKPIKQPKEKPIKQPKNLGGIYWSADEKTKLKALYYEAPVDILIEAFPNRNYESIRAQAQKLGLKRKLGYNLYGQAEEDILKTYYEKYGPDYCKQLIEDELGIKRSDYSIRDHATKVLKLHYHEKFTEAVGFDLIKFKTLYYNTGVQACMQEFNMTEQQVRLLASRHSLKRKKETIEHYAKKVYCIELDKIFHGCKEAADFIGGKTKGNISECCRGLRKSAYGYHWKYID